MLRDEDKKEIVNRLNAMKDDVTLTFFTQQLAGTCMYCTETEQLLKEVSDLSEKLTMNIKNFVTDKEDAESFGVDKIPATVMTGKTDFGNRFYGIPSGYEFAAFLEMIIKVSHAESGMSEAAKNSVQGINQPVHLQVFVTPTCPYCTKAALLAQQCAMENENIRADIIEVTEFPHLGQKYEVMGVPKIVINEDYSFEGAMPEEAFVEEILKAVKEE